MPIALVCTFGIVLSAFLIQSGTDWVSPGQEKAFSELARLPMSVLTVVLGLRLILRDDLGGERRSWVLLEIAFVVGLAAHVVSLAQVLVAGSAPFPTVADYLYSAPIPAMVAGVMLLPATVRSRAERRKLLVDSLIVVAGACTALWYLEIAPLLQIPEADFEAIAFAATVPVLDLLLLFALATLVLRRPNLGLVLRLLAASILLKVFTDTTYILAIVQFDVMFAPGSWPFLLWVTADFLVLLSVHHRLQHDDLHGPGTRQYPSFGWLPYVAIALAYGMLVFVARHESLYALGGMILGAMVLTGLVIVRQVIAQRESHRMAVTDSLTGLSSRARINEQVAEMARHPAHDGQCKAVLLIDLDHFKPINDTYGHEAGDAVLKAVATSMRHVIRSGDTAGRLGGDEFAVVLPDLPSREAAETVARRLVEAFSTPVIFGDLLLNVAGSIGVAIHDQDTLNQPERLLAHADVAMYVAKRAGRSTFCVYTPELDPRAQDAELRRAVANNEMVVHFQPVVRLADGHEVGVEALVRWNHPTRGLLMPGAFIELAEETGAVVPIGEWVLREACRQAADWRQTYPQAQNLTLSVNLSVRQVTRADLQSTIVDILTETGFPADHLVLELTESVVLEPDEATVARMAALRRMGVGISIDDFGTGYAALSYLRSLPVTVLKIDRSFVAGIDTDADAWAATEALVHLAKAFKLGVVAEGIETVDQANCLKDMGCGLGQGYHYARPMTGAALTQRWSSVRLGLPS